MLQLDPPEVLLTIAEIAVAFAGFASLSTIVANKFAGERLEVATSRLRILLGSSLSTIAVAFLPIVMTAFAVSASLLWQGSANSGNETPAGFQSSRRRGHVSAHDALLRFNVRVCLWFL